MAGISVLGDPALQALADRLQARSVAQEPATGAYFAERVKAGDLSWEGFDDRLTAFMADKLVALEPVKAEFCHMLCRAMQARRVVEVCTSFGVSTLYLAAAVRANGGREDRGGQPRLTGDRSPDRGEDIEVLVQTGGGQDPGYVG